MATIALDIDGQGVAVQSYQHKVQLLNDVIVRHLGRFRRIARRLLGNIPDAEDAVQDAFLSAFTHLDQFRGQAKMSTWLTAIVINAARMKLRQRSPQAQISLDETRGEQSLMLAETLPDHQPNPEEVCFRRELAERLVDATTQLSPTLRKTFQLRDLNGLSTCETAYLLGVPRGTVKSQLARGRVRLKEIVRKSLRGNGDATRSTPADSNPQKSTEAHLAPQLTGRPGLMSIELSMWTETLRTECALKHFS